MPSFTDNVRRLVPRIPVGKVLNYETVACLAGSPDAAAAVGRALGSPGETCGWHRVVAKSGVLTSPERDRQYKLLVRDGVKFDRDGVVNMTLCRCDGATVRSGNIVSENIVASVRRNLDNLEIAGNATTGDWTTAVKTALCVAGKQLGCLVGALSSEVAASARDYGEWLYDVTWVEYEGDFIVDTPLVAECEWSAWEAIEEDFQKLLLARAGVRLMIFDGEHDLDFTETAVERMAEQVRNFSRSHEDDTWLIGAWVRTGGEDRGWCFRWFTITRGGAEELGPL